MYKNGYNMTLNKDGEEINLTLRLTVGSQFALKKKYKMAPLQLILTGIDDPEVFCDVVEEALNFKDNTNAVTSGTEFYDLAVDNGFAGSEDFGAVMLNVAKESGLLKEKQAQAILNKLNNVVDEALEKELKDEEEAEKN